MDFISSSSILECNKPNRLLCCRLESICTLTPPPIFFTKGGFLFFSQEGKGRVQETDRFFGCPWHDGCLPTDLIQIFNTSHPPPLDHHLFCPLPISDARSLHPWLRIALQWKHQLQNTTTPSMFVTIKILTIQDESTGWPPGIYLCDQANNVINCRMLGSSCTGNINWSIPIFEGAHEYHALWITTHKSPDTPYMNDKLYFALLDAGIVVPLTYVISTGNIRSDNNVLLTSTHIVRWRSHISREIGQKLLSTHKIECGYIWPVDNKPLTMCLLRFLFKNEDERLLYAKFRSDPAAIIIKHTNPKITI